VGARKKKAFIFRVDGNPSKKPAKAGCKFV
jgi:hypothetical protein